MIVKCPECNSVSKRSDELAGKQVRCPRCKAGFVAESARPQMWYYADGDNKIGPINQESFDSLVGDGTIAPETLVWCKGMDGWQPLQANTEKSDQCHGTALKYGGLGSRFIAKVLDLILMLVFAWMVEGLSRKLFPGAFTLNTGSPDGVSPVVIVTVLINMLLGIFYLTWFVGKFGATPGKMVVKLKITNPVGGKIGYSQAFGRYCGEYIAALGVVSGMTLLAFWVFSSFFPLNPVLTSVFVAIVLAFALVYGPALFDPQRRTLYDRLCRTRVLAA